MTRPRPYEAILGIGANLGDPVVQLREAVENLPGIARVSSVYRSEPVGERDQPDFYNIVCTLSTRLTPAALLEKTGDIERRLGRERGLRNGPRPIDIDLLSYDDLEMNSSNLTLPHPRLHERAFVLLPLREIAPEWRHPTLGQTADEILSTGGPFERIQLWGSLPGWTTAR